MSLIFREDYWNNPDLKRELIGFVNQIHNLDLTLWDELGFWDRKYRPFSFFDGETMVANVCIYSMDMMIEGQRRRVAQVSAVGTHPEYCRQGLSSELTKKAMDWARPNHDFFFLFADEEAVGFYHKRGFQPVEEYKTQISVSGKAPQPGAEKLDTRRDDHRTLIDKMAAERSAVSDTLGVFNRKLFMFWCLYFLKDQIYHIPELDILVLLERKERLVSLFDIVGKKIPVFNKVYPFICDKNDQTVEFLFMPDKLNLSNPTLMKVTENGTHYFGDFPFVNRKFILPYTAHA